MRRRGIISSQTGHGLVSARLAIDMISYFVSWRIMGYITFLDNWQFGLQRRRAAFGGWRVLPSTLFASVNWLKTSRARMLLCETYFREALTAIGLVGRFYRMY
jgi:hypothetical protein